MIGRHKFLCPKPLFDPNLWTALHPNVASHVAVAINILNDVLEPDLHGLPLIHAATSSQGLPPSLSGNASKASSRRSRSHTVRASILFGPGIRPSFTISSNFDGEIPI